MMILLLGIVVCHSVTDVGSEVWHTNTLGPATSGIRFSSTLEPPTTGTAHSVARPSQELTHSDRCRSWSSLENGSSRSYARGIRLCAMVSVHYHLLYHRRYSCRRFMLSWHAEAEREVIRLALMAVAIGSHFGIDPGQSHFALLLRCSSN